MPTGEFYDDEDIKVLQVARARKGSHLPPSNVAANNVRKNTQTNVGANTTANDGNPRRE